MIFILILKRLIVGALCIVLGFLVLKFTAKLMIWFGSSDWAENIPGGTGLVWKVTGILLVAAGIAVVFGGFKNFGL
jgi:hypothetical protein